MKERPSFNDPSNFKVCWFPPTKRAVIHREGCWHWQDAHYESKTTHPRDSAAGPMAVYEAPPVGAQSGYFATLSAVREIIRGLGWEAIDDDCLYFSN